MESGHEKSLKPSSIDDYTLGFPPDIQKKLEELRALIKAAAPEASEKISYGIPTTYKSSSS